MSDLVKRLLDADWNSQQRFLGSRIFGEAADRISQQDAELERYRAAFSAIIERSHNDPLGTSKVVDMRRIAEQALEETLHG